MVRFKLSNVLEVFGLSEHFIRRLKSYCTVDLGPYAPEDSPSVLQLLERKKESIIIPRGLYHILKEILDEKGIKSTLEYNTVTSKKLNLTINPNINYKTGPFGYQNRVINELLQYDTVRLQSPTGSGKTLIASAFFALANEGPVLFLADQDKLIEQFVTTAKSVLGLEDADIGIIKAKKHIIKPITVGSLKTIGREGFDLNAIKNTFTTVIIDECHIASAITYRKVIMGLAPKRFFGLSATPDHYASEDLNKLMECLLGPIWVEVDPKEIPGRIIPEIEFITTNCSFPFKVKEDSPEWMKRKCRHKLHKDMASNEKRNRIIVNKTKELVSQGHTVLITLQRVFHGSLLKDMFEQEGIQVCFPYKVTGTEEDDDEKTTVDHKTLTREAKEIQAGKIKVLIGTASLFKKGFDLKELSVLIMAGAANGSNTTNLIQLAGRIQRYCIGKSKARIIDFWDTSYPNNILNSWALDREKNLNNLE